MSGSKVPQRVEEWGVESLWRHYWQDGRRAAFAPEDEQVVHDIFVSGALCVATLWHGLEQRADISAEARAATAARLVSEGSRICSDMDVPETFRAPVQ